MAQQNVNVELTRKEQYYGSRKLTQEVRKLEERFDKSEDVRVPVIASVCLEVGMLPGGANFAAMTVDEQIAFIKNNDSLFCANFDNLIELLATIAEGKTLSQKKKWAIEFLERQINVLDPLPGEPEVRRKKVNTGVAVLDFILAKIKRVNWKAFANEKSGEVSETNYILRTVERTLETSSTANHPMIDRNGSVYCYTNTHFRMIEVSELRNFLIEAAIRCGVPSDKAIYFVFVDKLIRQFYINAGRQGSFTKEPDTAFINLKNGTLFFDKGKHRFEPHTADLFIRYVLDFDYNPEATAPRWQEHLGRSLPHFDKQMYLAKCLALPFYKGKIEKTPILYGQRDTGKSTTLDVYKVLVGAENISTETLSALTQADYHGLYARARLDGKLVNIASDISKKISDEGLAKTLISCEAVSARRPNKEGFDMRDYARLVFAMNELPPQFFSDAALAKRAAIIEFDQQVTPQKKDTDFAEKIIANELPGVLNWIIDGLTQLNATGRLDAPPCCIEAMDKIREENDPLAGWLGEKEYCVGNQNFISLKAAYDDFREYCKENGNYAASKKTFTRRLRDVGYKIDRPNNHAGVMLYYTNSFLENESHQSHASPSLKNKSEKGDLSGTETGIDSFPKNESPDESPMSPHFHAVNIGAGTDGTNGHENSGKVFDVESAENSLCKKCTHHRPSSYPDGHCESGCVQQNLPCCDFVAKTPIALF